MVQDYAPLNSNVFPSCAGKSFGDNGCGTRCGSCGHQDVCGGSFGLNLCDGGQCKVVCTCNNPGNGGWAPGGNGFSCTDPTQNAYCMPVHDCVGRGSFEYGNFPCELTCRCNSPGQGAPNNGFTCSDSSKNAYCGPTQACDSGGYWRYGNFPCR